LGGLRRWTLGVSCALFGTEITRKFNFNSTRLSNSILGGGFSSAQAEHLKTRLSHDDFSNSHSIAKVAKLAKSQHLGKTRPASAALVQPVHQPSGLLL
jgi:hypothetical protein